MPGDDDIDLRRVRSALDAVQVPEFVAASNKRIVTDESVGRNEAEEEEMEEDGGDDGDGQRLLALMEGAKCKVGEKLRMSTGCSFHPPLLGLSCVDFDLSILPFFQAASPSAQAESGSQCNTQNWDRESGRTSETPDA